MYKKEHLAALMRRKRNRNARRRERRKEAYSMKSNPNLNSIEDKEDYTSANMLEDVYDAMFPNMDPDEIEDYFLSKLAD